MKGKRDEPWWSDSRAAARKELYCTKLVASSSVFQPLTSSQPEIVLVVASPAKKAPKGEFTQVSVFRHHVDCTFYVGADRLLPFSLVISRGGGDQG